MEVGYRTVYTTNNPPPKTACAAPLLSLGPWASLSVLLRSGRVAWGRTPYLRARELRRGRRASSADFRDNARTKPETASRNKTQTTHSHIYPDLFEKWNPDGLTCISIYRRKVGGWWISVNLRSIYWREKFLSLSVRFHYIWGLNRRKRNRFECSLKIFYWFCRCGLKFHMKKNL